MKQGKEFLQQFFHENVALSKSLKEHSNIFSLWPKVLLSLGLKNLAQNSKVLDFQQQILTIGVSHSVFLQDLKLQQAKWQKALEHAMQEALQEAQQNQKNTKIVKIRYSLQSKL